LLPTTEHEDASPGTDRASGVGVFLRSIGWKHAIVELVLIILGVLAALAVNNWNDERRQRRLELATLGQLRVELAGDLAALRELDDAIRERERRMVALLADLDRGVDSSDVGFGAVLRIWGAALNRSAYETLKVRGLDLVSNDNLRLRIVAVYENVYGSVNGSQADDRSVVFDLVRPYYLKNFRGIRFGESATPLDRSAVVRDPYFRNLVEYRLASLRSNQIGSVEPAITQITELIAALDATALHRS